MRLASRAGVADTRPAGYVHHADAWRSGRRWHDHRKRAVGREEGVGRTAAARSIREGRRDAGHGGGTSSRRRSARPPPSLHPPSRQFAWRGAWRERPEGASGTNGTSRRASPGVGRDPSPPAGSGATPRGRHNHVRRRRASTGPPGPTEGVGKRQVGRSRRQAGRGGRGESVLPHAHGRDDVDLTEPGGDGDFRRETVVPRRYARADLRVVRPPGRGGFLRRDRRFFLDLERLVSLRGSTAHHRRNPPHTTHRETTRVPRPRRPGPRRPAPPRGEA